MASLNMRERKEIEEEEEEDAAIQNWINSILHKGKGIKGFISEKEFAKDTATHINIRPRGGKSVKETKVEDLVKPIKWLERVGFLTPLLPQYACAGCYIKTNLVTKLLTDKELCPRCENNPYIHLATEVIGIKELPDKKYVILLQDDGAEFHQSIEEAFVFPSRIDQKKVILQIVLKYAPGGGHDHATLGFLTTNKTKKTVRLDWLDSNRDGSGEEALSSTGFHNAFNDFMTRYLNAVLHPSEWTILSSDINDFDRSCPLGLQHLQVTSEEKKTQEDENSLFQAQFEPVGYCQSWSVLVAFLSLVFYHKTIEELTHDIIEGAKQQKLSLGELIRRFSWNINARFKSEECCRDDQNIMLGYAAPRQKRQTIEELLGDVESAITYVTAKYAKVFRNQNINTTPRARTLYGRASSFQFSNGGLRNIEFENFLGISDDSSSTSIPFRVWHEIDLRLKPPIRTITHLLHTVQFILHYGEQEGLLEHGQKEEEEEKLSAIPLGCTYRLTSKFRGYTEEITKYIQTANQISTRYKEEKDWQDFHVNQKKEKSKIPRRVWNLVRTVALDENHTFASIFRHEPSLPVGVANKLQIALNRRGYWDIRDILQEFFYDTYNVERPKQEYNEEWVEFIRVLQTMDSATLFSSHLADLPYQRGEGPLY